MQQGTSNEASKATKATKDTKEEEEKDKDLHTEIDIEELSFLFYDQEEVHSSSYCTEFPDSLVLLLVGKGAETIEAPGMDRKL